MTNLVHDQLDLEFLLQWQNLQELKGTTFFPSVTKQHVRQRQRQKARGHKAVL